MKNADKEDLDNLRIMVECSRGDRYLEEANAAAGLYLERI